jgi:hypothetical protein
MRLSEIQLRCQALGEADPETNVTKVERAGCIFDGVELITEAEGELDDARGVAADAEDRVVVLEDQLGDIKRVIRRLEPHIKASGKVYMDELNNLL